MYFESHAHFDDKKYDEDRESIIKQMYDDGVTTIVNIGADIETSRNTVKLTEKYDFFYGAVGIHPHDTKNATENNLIEFEEMAKSNKIVAIGEIGLDLFYEHSDKEVQIYWFKKQLELAKKLDMPIVIHSRDADQLVFDIVKESGVRKGVVHCYSGKKELANEYIKLGFKIGIGGVVTFKNSKLYEVVADIGLDNILIETDSPYLSPEPFRGSRNNSSNLKYICNKIADIVGVSAEEVAYATYENAKATYEII